jgi:hypothetical protein
MKMTKIEKYWDNTYTCEKSDFELFNKWFVEMNIDKKIGVHYWTDLVDYKRFITPNEHDKIPYNTMFDHLTCWLGKNGKKYLISHPYWWYPDNWKQFEYHFKGVPCDFEPDLKELIKWCNDRNLLVKFYKTSESWYYPGNTIMFHIEENDIYINFRPCNNCEYHNAKWHENKCKRCKTKYYKPYYWKKELEVI